MEERFALSRDSRATSRGRGNTFDQFSARRRAADASKGVNHTGTAGIEVEGW